MPSKTWTIMAAGVPIIASFDMPSEMERTIEEAGCGFCVEAGNTDALVGTILNIHDDRIMAVQMSNNSRIYAEKKVSKNATVAEYIKIISEEVDM